MTVVCNAIGCPFCCENFCSKKGTVMLNASGFCSQLYDKNNMPRPNGTSPVDRDEKDLPIIIEGSAYIKNEAKKV